jgi:hypothetical protein
MDKNFCNIPLDGFWKSEAQARGWKFGTKEGENEAFYRTGDAGPAALVRRGG